MTRLHPNLRRRARARAARRFLAVHGPLCGAAASVAAAMALGSHNAPPAFVALACGFAGGFAAADLMRHLR